MWASDYPHTDSTFPNSHRAIEETLGALPADDVRKITATNCARLYGFPYDVSPSPDAVAGFDHVSLPMQDTDAMVAFYRALGFDVAEHPHVVSVYVGDQMINFHRPATWQREGFTLRAPNARPPCGDLCFVWDGTPDALHARLDEAGAPIDRGPGGASGRSPARRVERVRARPRREPPRVHDLSVKGTADAG